MVYQDERIGALKEWLRPIDFPCVAQSASLAEDIAVLRHSRYCVFGPDRLARRLFACPIGSRLCSSLGRPPLPGRAHNLREFAL